MRRRRSTPTSASPLPRRRPRSSPRPTRRRQLTRRRRRPPTRPPPRRRPHRRRRPLASRPTRRRLPRRRRHCRLRRRPLYGSPGTGTGTACNTNGSRGSTSPSRRRPQPIRRDIGSNAPRVGSGSAASGAMAPSGRVGETRSPTSGGRCGQLDQSGSSFPVVGMTGEICWAR